MNSKSHWDDIFQKSQDRELGWYDQQQAEIKRFLNLIKLGDSARLFFAGIGTSNLVNDFLSFNHQLILNDISSAAIEKLKQQIAANRDFTPNAQINWLCQDISKPLPKDLEPLDCWIDRAVLHFLLTDKAIKGYFNNLRKFLKPGGYALFAEFSKQGAKSCAGLPVKGYDRQDFCEQIPDFKLIKSENFTFTGPQGQKRPYIIALFQKNPEN